MRYPSEFVFTEMNDLDHADKLDNAQLLHSTGQYRYLMTFDIDLHQQPCVGIHREVFDQTIQRDAGNFNALQEVPVG